MRILSVNYSKEPMGLSNHYHDCHQILYVASGRVLFRVGEKEQIAESGALLILNRLEEHAIRPLNEEYRRYTLGLSPEGSSDAPLLSSLITRAKSFCHVLHPKGAEEALEKLFARMTREYRERPPLYEEMLRLELERFSILLYRQFPHLFATENTRGLSLTEEIQGRLERQFRDPVTLAELARDYHVSPSHLSHQFKQITGYAPMEYLQACRLSEAKRELAQGNRSIREIVDLCGFGDESNFSRTFRQRVGVTPTQFRKRYQKG